MSMDVDKAARQDRMLGKLADLAMDLACDAAAKAKKAETVDDTERFAMTFDRMARSVRLSIALSRKLERDAARDHAQRRAEAVDLRKARLRASLRSEISEACDHPNRRFECERELDSALAEDALYDRFVDMPLDQLISRLRQRLDLPVPPPERSPVEREGDREAVEAVEIHSPLSGRRPPNPTSSAAPPDRADAPEEHLEAADLHPAPS